MDGAWRHLAHDKPCHSSVYCESGWADRNEDSPVAYPALVVPEGRMNIFGERKL